jgi:hypothetical protein|tara:strand:- start:640 stop:846 length:207 start_codon:yes stop_codon:yes gene_type:complete
MSLEELLRQMRDDRSFSGAMVDGPAERMIERTIAVVKEMREAVNSMGYDEEYVWGPATEAWADRLEGK